MSMMSTLLQADQLGGEGRQQQQPAGAGIGAAELGTAVRDHGEWAPHAGVAGGTPPPPTNQEPSRPHGGSGDTRGFRDALFFQFATQMEHPLFDGNKDRFLDFRQRFLAVANVLELWDQFMGGKTRAVPVGNPSKSTSDLVQEGFSLVEIRSALHAWSLLSSALQRDADSAILRMFTSPKEAFSELEQRYNPQTVMAKQELLQKFMNFKIPSGSDPLKALIELEEIGYRI